jgi:hypothetical protein
MVLVKNILERGVLFVLLIVGVIVVTAPAWLPIVAPIAILYGVVLVFKWLFTSPSIRRMNSNHNRRQFDKRTQDKERWH